MLDLGCGPATDLSTFARLAGPGGTLIVDYPGLEVPRAYRRFIVERVVRNASIGRQLPGFADRAG